MTKTYFGERRPRVAALIIGVVWGAIMVLSLALVFGCTATPAVVIDERPIVMIVRQYVLVPLVQPPDPSCGGIENCWYEEPTEEGPI